MVETAAASEHPLPEIDARPSRSGHLHQTSGMRRLRMRPHSGCSRMIRLIRYSARIQSIRRSARNSSSQWTAMNPARRCSTWKAQMHPSQTRLSGPLTARMHRARTGCTRPISGMHPRSAAADEASEALLTDVIDVGADGFRANMMADALLAVRNRVIAWCWPRCQGFNLVWLHGASVALKSSCLHRLRTG